eukprot:6176341-Pleurochrysis_carterae.AAC.1
MEGACGDPAPHVTREPYSGETRVFKRGEKRRGEGEVGEPPMLRTVSSRGPMQMQSSGGGRRLACVERSVNSQSSMNSQRCESPASLASATRAMMLSSVSTMAFLYAKPPCERATGRT